MHNRKPKGKTRENLVSDFFPFCPFSSKKQDNWLSSTLVYISPPFKLIFLKWHYSATYHFLLPQLFLKKSKSRPISQFTTLESTEQWFFWNSSCWCFMQIDKFQQRWYSCVRSLACLHDKTLTFTLCQTDLCTRTCFCFPGDHPPLRSPAWSYSELPLIHSSLSREPSAV